jgi:hypothetical protein
VKLFIAASCEANLLCSCEPGKVMDQLTVAVRPVGAAMDAIGPM